MRFDPSREDYHGDSSSSCLRRSLHFSKSAAMNTPIDIFLGIASGILIVGAIVLVEMVAVDILQAIIEHNDKEKENHK